MRRSSRFFAGNVASADELASLEYGVEHLGARYLVVLGHPQEAEPAQSASG
jgi:hypothetical protein